MQNFKALRQALLTFSMGGCDTPPPPGPHVCARSPGLIGLREFLYNKICDSTFVFDGE
jgi:hypothetical protein